MADDLQSSLDSDLASVYGPGVGGGIPGLPSGFQQGATYQPTTRGGLRVTPQTLVWLGVDGKGGGNYNQYRQQNYNQDPRVPYESARNLPLSWDDSTLRQFVNQGILNKIPGFGPDMGMPEIISAWDDMVMASMGFNTSHRPGDKMWSPWDVMKTYSNNAGKFGTERRGDWIYDIATGKPVKYVGKTKKTTTSTDLDLSSPEDVEVIATQALREALGRAPTVQELAQFKVSINAAEKENPRVTKTTTTYNPNMNTGELEVVAQDSTTTGGISDAARASVVSGAAENTDEYAKYQGGTTYMNALMQLVSGGF